MKKTIIDFVYINSPGGLVLSKIVLDFLIKLKILDEIEVLLDKRNFNNYYNYPIKKIIINKSEISRYRYYFKNRKLINSVLCFANVPPPIRIKANTLVYFHNEIFINSRNLNFPLFEKLIFKLKWIYI